MWNGGGGAGVSCGNFREEPRQPFSVDMFYEELKWSNANQIFGNQAFSEVIKSLQKKNTIYGQTEQNLTIGDPSFV